jgi:hypothetical protein
MLIKSSLLASKPKKILFNFLNVDPDKIEVIYQGCHSAFKEEYTDAEKEGSPLQVT